MKWLAGLALLLLAGAGGYRLTADELAVFYCDSTGTEGVRLCTTDWLPDRSVQTEEAHCFQAAGISEGRVQLCVPTWDECNKLRGGQSSMCQVTSPTEYRPSPPPSVRLVWRVRP